MERISYLLSINAGLRLIFDRTATAYTYIRMENNNPPFHGKSPLDLLSTGRCQATLSMWKDFEMKLVEFSPVTALDLPLLPPRGLALPDCSDLGYRSEVSQKE